MPTPLPHSIRTYCNLLLLLLACLTGSTAHANPADDWEQATLGVSIVGWCPFASDGIGYPRITCGGGWLTNFGHAVCKSYTDLYVTVNSCLLFNFGISTVGFRSDLGLDSYGGFPISEALYPRLLTDILDGGYPFTGGVFLPTCSCVQNCDNTGHSIVDLFEIQPHEFQYLKTIIPEDVAKARHAESERARREKAGAVDRATYLDTAEQRRAQARLLIAKGLSLQDIASEIGISKSQVQRYLD